MKKKNEKPARLRFPDDEPRLPWLPMLLDVHAIIDKGISTAVREHEKKHKVKIACTKGCGNCCHTHKDIPVYPLELVGIYWFVVEKIVAPVRGVLKRQLLDHGTGAACPFLIGGDCSIHPLRPMACRQFNVFGTPCAQGEDPFYTRRNDVLTPIQSCTDKAFSIMLPFHGVTGEAAKARAIKGKLINTQVRVLQACSWKELARRMDDYDFSGR